MKKTRKTIRILFRVALVLLVLAVSAALLFNLIVILSTEQKIHAPSAESLDASTQFDCIIVLGCGVRDDGTPSDMLYDRIQEAVYLYQEGYAPKLLMSGDHGRAEYDEVNTMKRVAVEEFGVPSEDVFMDHAGFSTYETMARASQVFGVKKAIVVTQEYHLPRALYLARTFDIEAVGVSCDIRSYSGQAYRDLREAAARCKDFISAATKPSYMGGDPIDIHGNGDVTND